VPQPRQRLDRWSTFVPTWWLTLAWLAMTVGTVWSVPHGRWGLDHTDARVVTAVLFGAAAVSIRLVPQRTPDHYYAGGVVVAMATGLASLFFAPSGLGEVPVYVAASRIPASFPERSGKWFTAAATVATSLTIGYISHSIGGLLAGIGVPFLAQRALDRQALVEQRDRAEALLAEVQAGRDAESQAAALRERGRIAREMHDVLAHSLAGLSLQLQAARAIAQKEGAGAAVLEPLERAASLARDGLAEAKSAVGTLNDPALHTIDEVPDLVRLHPGDATLVVTGDPAPLPRRAGHAAYRAIQESLTNTARYAPGSTVRVSLDWYPGRLTVQVDDGGAAPGHTPLTGHGTGLGIAGMRERLSAVGGTVEAGPHRGGWRVSFTVPTVGVTTAATPIGTSPTTGATS